jgi:L-alanine-DL-glutamate epimerase-like enolase superfamily enzyme
MPVDYSESWRRLAASSKVPICTGENLGRRQGFKDFIIGQGCDILHPDLRNTGGFLETRRIADLAEVFFLPMATHNTGSLVHTIATAHWASTVRDFLVSETVVGQGDWMDDVVIREGPIIKEGFIQPSERPGLGLELNPDVVKAHLAAGESYW